MRANREIVMTFAELHELMRLPASTSIVWAVNDNLDNRAGLLRLMMTDETIPDLPPGALPLAQTVAEITREDVTPYPQSCFEEPPPLASRIELPDDDAPWLLFHAKSWIAV